MESPEPDPGFATIGASLNSRQQGTPMKRLQAIVSIGLFLILAGYVSFSGLRLLSLLWAQWQS